MTPSESTNVFVSYSHADASLVAPVVKLSALTNLWPFKTLMTFSRVGGAEVKLTRPWLNPICLSCSGAITLTGRTKFLRNGKQLSSYKRISCPFCWMQLLCRQSWVSFSGSTFEERSAQTTARLIRRITLLRQVRHRHGQRLR